MTERDVEEVQQGLEAVQITGSEVQKLQEKQRAAVQRAAHQRFRTEDSPSGSPIHPDLQDLSFGALGLEQRYAGPVLPQPSLVETLRQEFATTDPAKRAVVTRRS